VQANGLTALMMDHDATNKPSIDYVSDIGNGNGAFRYIRGDDAHPLASLNRSQHGLLLRPRNTCIEGDDMERAFLIKLSSLSQCCAELRDRLTTRHEHEDVTRWQPLMNFQTLFASSFQEIPMASTGKVHRNRVLTTGDPQHGGRS
jgi:hypothetical protein